MAELVPVVLVPGLASSARSHLPILPALWRHGPLTVANQTRDDTIAAMAARILRDAPSRFALLGHSLGGYIALEIIRQAPERVERLALLNTQARADTAEVSERRKAQIAAAREGRFLEAMDEMFPLLVHPARAGDEDLREQQRLTYIEVGADAFIRQQMAIMARIDSRPFLPAIKVPTLVLSSDEDRLVPNMLSREMADLIPGAKLVIVPNAGHMAPLEQPDEVIAALDDWFAA